jgi:hypothetical protein
VGIIEPRRGKGVITAIDYFTRKCFSEWIKDKTTKTVKEFVQRLQNDYTGWCQR